MNLPSIDKMPDNHRAINGAFRGLDDQDRLFEVHVRTVRARRSSSDMVRAHIRSNMRGRPMSMDVLYRDETEITLRMPNTYMKKIEILPNGSYRYGRRINRSLRELVRVLVDAVPAPSSPSPR